MTKSVGQERRPWAVVSRFGLWHFALPSKKLMILLALAWLILLLLIARAAGGKKRATSKLARSEPIESSRQEALAKARETNSPRNSFLAKGKGTRNKNEEDRNFSILPLSRN